MRSPEQEQPHQKIERHEKTLIAAFGRINTLERIISALATRQDEYEEKLRGMLNEPPPTTSVTDLIDLTKAEASPGGIDLESYLPQEPISSIDPRDIPVSGQPFDPFRARPKVNE